MTSILDQHGKPFKPDPIAELLRHAAQLLVLPPAQYVDVLKLDQLRQSCGVAPKTITFRRYSPWAR